MPRTSGADRSDENDPKRAFGNMDRNFKNDVASAPKSEDEIMLLRRKFLYLFAGVTTLADNMRTMPPPLRSARFSAKL